MKKIILFFYLFSLLACKTTRNKAMEHSEPHRPKFHFTSPANWMNDPNGMVFYEGEYHLFYQYYPGGTVWGPMHWGHAVSRDLVRWEHLPIALYPDTLGLIFSGSAVVDWNNTSGFSNNGKPPLVAIFTQHLMEGEKAGRNDFQVQSIAYSNDRGRTWTKYKGNPVIPNTNKIRDFRDPKVLWHDASKQWVMVFAAQDYVMFWGSPDLKHWTHLSDFGKVWGAHGGVWECPDLFPLTVEGTGEEKWVLLQSLNPGSANGGSGTQYFVGNFDGKNFTLDPGFAKSVEKPNAVWLDWGRDNYAGVTWSDIPKKDGRRLFVGWMSNWDYATVVPTQTWRSAMTIPRQLTLKQTPSGLRLFSHPAQELQTLRGTSYSLENKMLTTGIDLTDQLKFAPAAMEVLLEIDLSEGAKTDICIILSNINGEEYRIGFDAAKNEFYSDRTKAGNADFSKVFAVKRHTAPRLATSPVLRLQILFDVASCELFADGGQVTMTDIFFPSTDFSRIKLLVSGGKVKIKEGRFFQLQAAGSGK